MRVLIACEFSGIVRDEFTKLGHDAWSCDLEPTESVSEKHYVGDIRNLLTQPWDLMIAFPPCTYLAVSGARWWANRQQEQQDALDFVQLLFDAPIERIALENPIGKISSAIRQSDQIIQPWQFGHDETKATCLWLKGLPKLIPTKIMPEPHYPMVWWEAPGPNRKKNRSRTYKGIAEAMAQQWGK